MSQRSELKRCWEPSTGLLNLLHHCLFYKVTEVIAKEINLEAECELPVAAEFQGKS